MSATSQHHDQTLPPIKPATRIEMNPASISRVTFFGTSSAVPQPGRANVSSLCVGLSSGSNILVDCGEATQHQLMLSQSIRMGRIDVILITHLHGDHFFGIFGLLASLGTLARTAPLTVVGPKGLKQAIDAVFNTELHEDHSTQPTDPQDPPKSPPPPSQLTDDDNGGYDLKIIEVPTDIPTLLGSIERGADPSDTFTLSGSLGVDIMCVPIEHRVPCVGYVIHERYKAGKLDAKKAKELGAQPKEMALLKSGQNITLPNGEIVYSHDVLSDNIPGKSLAVIQDTHDPTKFREYFNNLDVMIHECTYEDEMYAKSIDHGHSTPSMAATFAFAQNAKNVFLTHFSSRYLKEHPCLVDNGHTRFNRPDLNPFVPRALLHELSDDQLQQIKSSVQLNNQTIVNGQQSTSKTQTKTAIELMTDNLNDTCCGNDDHHDHDDKAGQEQSQDQTSLPLRKQRIDPQKLAFSSNIPFATRMRTTDFGIRATTLDLKAQAQFCVEQLWDSYQQEFCSINPQTQNQSIVNPQSHSQQIDEIANIQAELRKAIPPPTPPTINQLINHHNTSPRHDVIQLASETSNLPQHKPTIFLGCDFRIFDFHYKTQQWTQLAEPDIDLAKYTAFKRQSELF